MRKILLLTIILMASCQKQPTPQTPDEEEYKFTGENFISLNGERFDIDLQKVDTLRPEWLAVDSYNSLTVNIDPKYTVYFDGKQFKNGADYHYNIAELSDEKPIKIEIKNQEEAYKYIIDTYPDDLNLEPMTINNPSAGYYYCGIQGFAIKLDHKGNLVYYRDGKSIVYFNRAEIDGTVYYSFLEEIEHPDHPKYKGVGYFHRQAIILDKNYQEIDRVTSIIATGDLKEGMPLENHQFTVLGYKHYLVSAYIGEIVDNIPEEVAGTTESVHVIAPVIQEIKDGKLVFQWKGTEHPEFYAYADQVNYTKSSEDRYLDYMHINSSTIDPYDGNLVMSSRTSSSIIKVNKATGETMWILGGKGDMFSLSGDQSFRGQHCVQVLDKGVITIFNNNCYGSTKGNLSSAMKFYLDEESRTVLDYEKYVIENTLSNAQGSAQELSKGHYMLGLGLTNIETYRFCEVDFNTGEVLFGVGNGKSQSAYNAFKYSE